MAALSSKEGIVAASPLKPGVQSNEGIVVASSSNEVIVAAHPLIVIVVVTSRSKEGIMAVQQGVFSFSLFAPSPPILMGVAPPSSLAREVVAAVVVAVAVLREAGLIGGGAVGGSFVLGAGG